MSSLKMLSFVLALTTSIGVGICDASAAKKPAPSSTSDKKPIVDKKLTIISLEGTAKFVAQYNPKELRVDKAVPWQKSKTSKSDQPELEFSGADGRTMAFELMFDTFEAGTDVHQAHVAKLLALAMVMDANGSEDKKRPPRVKVTWGSSSVKFEGVIESVEVRYTMFLPDGTPVRATCSVKLKEASRATLRK